MLDVLGDLLAGLEDAPPAQADRGHLAVAAHLEHEIVVLNRKPRFRSVGEPRHDLQPGTNRPWR